LAGLELRHVIIKLVFAEYTCIFGIETEDEADTENVEGMEIGCRDLTP
jgi:hypothetical protein